MHARSVDHDDIDAMRRHPAWRLLGADTAPLVLSVLGRTFVDGAHGPMSEPRLVALVDDALYAVTQTYPGR